MKVDKEVGEIMEVIFIKKISDVEDNSSNSSQTTDDVFFLRSCKVWKVDAIFTNQSLLFLDQDLSRNAFSVFSKVTLLQKQLHKQDNDCAISNENFKTIPFENLKEGLRYDSND